jgi:hypothetical protein
MSPDNALPEPEHHGGVMPGSSIALTPLKDVFPFWDHFDIPLEYIIYILIESWSIPALPV